MLSPNGGAPCPVWGTRVQFRQPGPEATIGDPDLARQRIEICDALPLLAISDAERLAPLLLHAAGMSPNAATDALHVAVAAVHGMEYLLSWNCRHIANATIRRAIDKQCRRPGMTGRSSARRKN